MTAAAIAVLAATVAGWFYIFAMPRPGIWRRSWITASLLTAISAAALWSEDQLGTAVGTIDASGVFAGLGVGVGWLVVTQIGHRVLCRILPAFIDQVRDLYSIAGGDDRRSIAVALVTMAVAEEFVFRLVVQREFGIVTAVVAYAAVQAVERNWALVVAGAACGAVWGLLYAWQDALAAPLIAHIVWTSMLTFVWPLRGCAGNAVPEADGIALTDR